MATTLSIRDSLAYVVPLLKNQRLNVSNLQPGLGMANIVLQRMLGAPFVWRFNRKSFNFTIATACGTDYTAYLPGLGRIETQWLTDTTGKIFELQGAVELPKVTAIRRPQRVAPVYDDNMGNITFRFDTVPDQPNITTPPQTYSYTAWFDYQQKAPLITSYSSTFGPVPDEFAYLFNKGMLAEGGQLNNDARIQIWERDFVAGLLATQDGLDAQSKAIFYEQMLNTSRTAMRSQGMGQTGMQGRQV